MIRFLKCVVFSMKSWFKSKIPVNNLVIQEDRWIGFESITSSICGNDDDDDDTGEGEQGSQLTKEAYIGLFVRRLGMDNLPEDREQALRALWRHSMNGKGNIDQIVSFPGILTLIVSLLPSNRVESSEAAAGLLRNISLYDDHRNDVIQVGAVEEIIGILTRRTLSQQVRKRFLVVNLTCGDIQFILSNNINLMISLA